MAFVRRPTCTWRLRTRSLALGQRTLIMGILNVTPDSFSDGGAFCDKNAAIEHALAMLEQGADIIDIGGESTRPGAQELSPAEERERVVPVIEGVLRHKPEAILSIDTYKAAIADAALAAGAELVNDVSAFAWDSEMASTCARLRCGVVLMHTRGRPAEWRTQPRLRDEEVVPLVKRGLTEALERAAAANVERERIVLDPGYGFGKAYESNYPLLAHLGDLLSLGQPLLAGVSRKSFLGRTLAGVAGTEVPMQQRGNATLAATTAAILAGASIVRVHDVRPALEAAAIADAILAGV
jgi:dihydropteroate synthase